MLRLVRQRGRAGWDLVVKDRDRKVLMSKEKVLRLRGGDEGRKCVR